MNKYAVTYAYLFVNDPGSTVAVSRAIAGTGNALTVHVDLCRALGGGWRTE